MRDAHATVSAQTAAPSRVRFMGNLASSDSHRITKGDSNVEPPFRVTRGKEVTPMNLTRMIAISLLSATMAFPKGKEKVQLPPTAPLPDRVLQARTVMVTSEADKLVYDQAYRRIQEWGRFQLTGDPERADVILIIRSGYGPRPATLAGRLDTVSLSLSVSRLVLSRHSEFDNSRRKDQARTLERNAGKLARSQAKKSREEHHLGGGCANPQPPGKNARKMRTPPNCFALLEVHLAK